MVDKLRRLKFSRSSERFQTEDADSFALFGAKINGCCIGFTESGGDGVADPALGATDILFR